MAGLPRGGDLRSQQVQIGARVISFLAIPLAACVACSPAQTDQAATLVTSSDPLLARAAATLLPDLANRSGLELQGPVRLERRTRGELERYLEFKLDEELPDSEAELLTESYGLFGLVPRDMDLRAVLKGLYLEQVAGFYDPDSTTLFVLDDQPEEALSRFSSTSSSMRSRIRASIWMPSPIRIWATTARRRHRRPSKGTPPWSCSSSSWRRREARWT